jgi:hypothetical protein
MQCDIKPENIAIPLEPVKAVLLGVGACIKESSVQDRNVRTTGWLWPEAITLKQHEKDDSDSDLSRMPACSPITVVTSLAGLIFSPGLLQQFDLVRCHCDKIVGKEADGVASWRAPTIYKTDVVTWKSATLVHEDDELWSVP